MDAALPSHTPVLIYDTTQRQIPDASNLHCHSRENPKYHPLVQFIAIYFTD